MSYAGDATLDPKIQQRILTAFAEAVRLYREGHNEESLTVLRSIADVDAAFTPAQRLEAAINAGAPVDLAQLLGEMTAASAVDVEGTMAKARQAFDGRDFQAALTLAQTVLKDLPGHAEARRLALEAQARVRGAAELQGHLERARQALAGGQVDEAKSFVRLAKNADPNHPEVEALEQQIVALVAPPPPSPEPEFEFESFDHPQGEGPDAGATSQGSHGPIVAPTTWDEVPALVEPVPMEPPVAPSSFEPSFGSSFEASEWEALPGAPAEAPLSAMPVLEPQALPGPPASVTAAPSSLRPAAAPIPTATVPTPQPAWTAGAAGPVAQGSGKVAMAAAGFALETPVDEQGTEFSFEDAGAPPLGGELGPAPMGAPQFGQPSSAPAHPKSSDSRVEELLDHGQQAFDSGDFQGAIETWSRIYLIDARHPDAEARIELARRRREEVEREAEHRYYEAREAYEQGRQEEARMLCQEVLRLQPQHLEAHDLLLRLETPAAPPPPPGGQPLADVEEDLFKDDFVPAAIVAPHAGPAVLREAEPAFAEVAPEQAAARPTRRSRGSKLPVPLLVGGVAVLLLTLGAIFFLGGKMFSSDSNALAGALRQADQLAVEGRLQEAIQVLESMQNQVHGEQLNLLLDRLREYKGKLQKRATPVPTFDFQAVRDAIAASQRLKAYRLIQEGLAKYPTDLELTRLQNEVTAYSPAYPPLLRSISSKSWETVMRLAEQITERHPDDSEARRLWIGAAYNFSVELLSKYQVAQAHTLLGELLRKQDDPAADKLRQFAKSYLSRPVDPRYKIFVDNVELRAVD